MRVLFLVLLLVFAACERAVPVPLVPDADADVTATPRTDLAPEDPEYSWEEVALHDARNGCWTVIDGVVYDLTSFVNQHPGGAGNIARLCGVDGTDGFTNMHGGQSRPERQLEMLRIGIIERNT